MRSHILGQWLGFDFSASPHLKGVISDSEQLRNRGLMYLGEYLKGLSAQGPVVLLLEDIHWADDSSLDALNWLGERIRRQRLLIACAARLTLYERRPHWGEGLAFHRRINLEPLSRRESRQLVAEILRLVDEVPPQLRELVVEGAEGNPFYVEELIKMLVEDGVVVKGEEIWHIIPQRLSEIEVPTTLAGVLQARLDSLPVEERVILQQASVVGRQFWDRIVAYIQSTGDGGEEIVVQVLSALRGRELIYQREVSSFTDAHEYIFKNDILREVIYESVLKRLRKVYHGLVADWLIAQGTGRTGEYNGMIADHLLQADRKGQAVDYFQRAGESALASYANGEAEVHLRNALELSLTDFHRAAALSGLGEALSRQGLREEAIQKIREAIDLYHGMEEYDRVAHLYARLAQVLWFADYQKAWVACQEGLARLEGAADSPGLAYLLAEAGRHAYFTAQSTEEVVTLCDRAINMAERLGIVEAQAEASITLAVIKGDPQQGIDTLLDAAALSEAHELLRTAVRAHVNLGPVYRKSLGGVNQSYQHSMKAAEIYRQMGDVDGMILAIRNVVSHGLNLGYLGTIEDDTAEFWHKSSATESQVKDCLQFTRANISNYRGEWMQFLEYIRAQLHEFRKGVRIQYIANFNLWRVDTILELHRFAGLDYLAEAEAALQENIDLHWRIHESRPLLALISARKGLIQEAQERLVEATRISAQSLTKEEESYHLRAKAELALVEEHWYKAISTWQILIDIYRTGGYRWLWARHLIDLGDALLSQNGPGDREGAQQAYRQSLEMFTEMGAPGYVKVLEQRLGG
jgi:tetratricopeptide (TPR) repeat protein